MAKYVKVFIGKIRYPLVRKVLPRARNARHFKGALEKVHQYLPRLQNPKHSLIAAAAAVYVATLLHRWGSPYLRTTYIGKIFKVK